MTICRVTYDTNETVDSLFTVRNFESSSYLTNSRKSTPLSVCSWKPLVCRQDVAGTNGPTGPSGVARSTGGRPPGPSTMDRRAGSYGGGAGSSHV